MTLEHYQGNDGDYYWHLQDGNNEIIADGSEGYETESGVKEAIENIEEEMAKDSPNIEHYQGNDGDYYWHLQDGNNEIIADGSEGYETESGVKEAIENVKNEF